MKSDTTLGERIPWVLRYWFSHRMLSTAEIFVRLSRLTRYTGAGHERHDDILREIGSAK